MTVMAATWALWIQFATAIPANHAIKGFETLAECEVTAKELEERWAVKHWSCVDESGRPRVWQWPLRPADR